jgi:NADPH2:quinone reductase
VEKATRAHEAGADEVILYSEKDFASEARRLTGGRGVDVVYDSVGKATWEASLKTLAPRGMLVLFGQSSGSVPPIDPRLLSQHGSLFMTRPKLGDYVATRVDLLERASEVLSWVADGELRLSVDRTFPLAQAADAHRALESRQTSGKLLLLP